MVICLERGADLHMAQLMPLPLTVSCFSKIQTGFTFLVPAHPGSPGKEAVKWLLYCAGGCVQLSQRCHCQHDAKLSGIMQTWVDLPIGNETAMLLALRMVGPLAAAVDASPISFQAVSIPRILLFFGGRFPSPQKNLHPPNVCQIVCCKSFFRPEQ